MRHLQMAGPEAAPAEAVAGIFFLEQEYQVPGTSETRRRTGFVARLQLEPFGNQIFRLEESHCNAPTAAPLLVLHDAQIELSTSAAALLSHSIDGNLQSRLWALTDEAAVERILQQVRSQKLVVASGAARYESALAAGEDAITAVFVNWSDPGLLALPLHRVIQDKPDYSTGVLVMNSRAYFFFQEVSRTMPPIDGDGPRFSAEVARELLTPVPPFASTSSDPHKVESAKSAEEAGARVSPGAARNSLVEDGDIAMLAVTRKQTFRMHSKPGWVDSILAHVPQPERNVDVTQLHRIILEGVLELPASELREGKYISYHQSTEEAVRRVHHGANVAFILSAPRLEKLREVALSGGVLPQRSVQFYPPLNESQFDDLE